MGELVKQPEQGKMPYPNKLATAKEKGTKITQASVAWGKRTKEKKKKQKKKQRARHNKGR